MVGKDEDGSFLELIYLDGGDARQTGVSCTFGSMARNREALHLWTQHEVPAERATFLIDLHDDAGDIEETVMIDDAGFRAITGREPEPAETYRRTDREYWEQARKASKGAVA